MKHLQNIVTVLLVCVIGVGSYATMRLYGDAMEQEAVPVVKPKEDSKCGCCLKCNKRDTSKPCDCCCETKCKCVRKPGPKP